MYQQIFWCFIALVVYLRTRSVYADTPLDGDTSLHPEFMECLKEFDMTQENIWEAKKSGNFDGIDPCFLACFFKKFEAIDSKGMYAVDKALAFHAPGINPDVLANIERNKKKCESVNDVKVSDGDKGCERATLLFKCFHAQKHDMAMNKEDE